MDSNQQHLTLVELCDLAQGSPDLAASDHLAACAECAAALKTLRDRSQSARLQGAGSANTARSACPPFEEILRATIGELSPEQADSLWAHVAQCEACGAALREMSHVLASDLSPEETALVAKVSDPP